MNPHLPAAAEGQVLLTLPLENFGGQAGPFGSAPLLVTTVHNFRRISNGEP